LVVDWNDIQNIPLDIADGDHEGLKDFSIIYGGMAYNGCGLTVIPGVTATNSFCALTATDDDSITGYSLWECALLRNATNWLYQKCSPDSESACQYHCVIFN
jgi:hypothetical protein